VHCHASEEEVFVILGGDGVCILGDEEHPVRAGSVVARPSARARLLGRRIGVASPAGSAVVSINAP
jgi:hypothetical protein